MERTSPDSPEYFAVEPRAITRRYENRERPVMISSENPSARAFTSALPPEDLNGSTATQNPSSARVAPDAEATPARAGTLEPVIGRGPLRAISWNSLLTSRAVCTRWRGSFSRHRRITRARSPGRSVRKSVTGGGVSRRIAEINSADEVPTKGGLPVDI